MARWTIRDVVQWSAEDFSSRGIDSARLDAELLVSEALGLDRVRLYMDLDRPLTEVERGRVRELVKRRRRREPIAYILERRDFYGRTFRVTPAVLIPRPDTETLVERALVVLEEEGGRVLDLCTGSGAIGLTLLGEVPELTADLTDLSRDALAVAKKNAAALGVVERATFHEGDLFEPLPADAQYRLIAVNPPYIAQAEVPELQPDVRDHEPRLALVSGPTGFEVLNRLAEQSGQRLLSGGRLLVEVGAGQATRFRAQLNDAPWVASTAVHEDLSGILRVVEAKRA
ncbi:MAG: peptide chain release factor N(5)-glutamine methyltransferase [Sandaracinaceae bacterium]